MIWIFVGIIAILLLSFYNLVAKLFSSEISSLYAIPFVSLGVFIAGMISILTTKVISIENLKFSINGAALAIFAGLLWGLGGIFYFLMFSKGTPLSMSLPFVVGGLTIIGSIFGILFLKESATIIKIIGIITIFLGLIILSRSK